MQTAISIWIAYFLLNLTGCSQTNNVEKGYAYARQILSGVKPTVSLSENGSITSANKEPGIQYFIFFESKDTSGFVVKNIWIKGKEYFAEAEPIITLPIIVEDDSYVQKKNDTLVAEGGGNVWKINVGRLVSPADIAFRKPKQSFSHDVLIGFLNKGSLHYYPIAEIKFLEPVRLQ